MTCRIASRMIVTIEPGKAGRTHSSWLPLAVFVLATATASAQEPQTRSELLARQRETKATQLKPPQPNRVERALLTLENRRLFERLLNPPEGFYPKLGNVTAGSGFALGPAFRGTGMFGEHADFNAFAAGTFTRYWMIETRLTMPRLARGRAFADIFARRYDFPQEDFFGLGPDSRRGDHATFDFGNTEAGGAAGVRPAPWLSFSGGLAYLTPRIGRGRANPSIETVFAPSEIPGLAEQPDFVRYDVTADLNYREPLGNPRQGGRYTFRYQQFDDRETERFGFHRFELDLQQYIPILKDRRVLALHALTSLSDASHGRDLPFYLQRTLGGPDDLRGFRRFRFRDRNLLLLQAEYRWEIFTAVDGAIFYDAGKVARTRDDLDLSDLETDYGIGFRFGSSNGVFLRVEGAFGSSGGKHFVLRFGNVF